MKKSGRNQKDIGADFAVGLSKHDTGHHSAEEGSQLNKMILICYQLVEN